jgi:hypothetical protein
MSGPIPRDYPVRPLEDGEPAKGRVTCGTCNRSWDDSISTSMTPTPSGRCPFEAWHDEEEEEDGEPAIPRHYSRPMVRARTVEGRMRQGAYCASVRGAIREIDAAISHACKMGRTSDAERLSDLAAALRDLSLID